MTSKMFQEDPSLRRSTSPLLHTFGSERSTSPPLFRPPIYNSRKSAAPGQSWTYPRRDFAPVGSGSEATTSSKVSRAVVKTLPTAVAPIFFRQDTMPTLGKDRVHKSPPSPSAPSPPPSPLAIEPQTSLILELDIDRQRASLATCITAISTRRPIFPLTEKTGWPQAFTELRKNAPAVFNIFNQWLTQTFSINLSEMHQIDELTREFLQSPTSVLFLEQLKLALKDLKPLHVQLKQLTILHEVLAASKGKSINFKAHYWDNLPREVQILLSQQVLVISKPSKPADHYGRTEIEKKPSILYSLNGRNILQEQSAILSEHISNLLDQHLEIATKKCLRKTLLKIEDTAYQTPIAFAEKQIKQLKTLKNTLQQGDSAQINTALAHYFKNDKTTTDVLQHLIWIADGKPSHDIEYGRNAILGNPSVLLATSEDQVDGSLIDWAIQFYERRKDNYRTLAYLEALERKFTANGSRLPIPELLWIFQHSDLETIQKPLFTEMRAQGIDRTGFERNPLLLTTSPAGDAETEALSPLAALIRKTRQECEPTILEHIQALDARGKIVNIPEGSDSSEEVIDAVGVERFLQDLTLLEQITDSLRHKQKVAILTPEYAKLYDSGGLAQAVHGLVKALAEKGQTAKVIMPYYHDLLPPDLLSAIVEKPEYTILDGTKDKQRCTVLKLKLEHQAAMKLFGLKPADEEWAKNVRFYMIKPQNKKWFKEGYGGSDEQRRFAYFQSAAVELLNQMNVEDKHGRRKIDLFQANDWTTSLVAQGLESRYPKRELPSLYTIHNCGEGYQPRISVPTLEWSNLRKGATYSPSQRERGLNTVVEGILSHRQVVTVSRNYAKEIQTPQLGFGIDPRLRYVAQSGRLSGIVNGNNTANHDPSMDASLRNWVDPITGKKPLEADPMGLCYGMDTPNILEKKQLIKAQLQKWFDLYMPDVHLDLTKPLFFYIGRLVDQKGLDLLEPMVDKIIAEGGQFIGIGMGGNDMDPTTKAFVFKARQQIRHKWGNSGATFIFDEWVAHKTSGARVRKYQQGDGEIPGIGSLLRAATDIFLMPSKFEPCGLTQGEAKRYGTPLTVATETGGLVDTETTLKSARGDRSRVTAFLCPRIGGYYDWHKLPQMRAFVDTIGEAMEFYRSLSDEEKEAKMRYVMDIAARSSWTETPDSSPAPIDQYLRLYAATQHTLAPHRRLSAKLHIPFSTHDE
ncbi:MAG: glycogen/starch synthase [Simkania sp.]|nr:glycogen/starch synthase [Simkania sp.]